LAESIGAAGGEARRKEEWKNKKLTWRGRNEDVGSVVESRDGMGWDEMR
jgi:hypothetical protein